MRKRSIRAPAVIWFLLVTNHNFIMFSFHRPKVYRSSTGCCICKAKSSSSRFTDSKKYEDDFLECFQLSTPRQGEICNACVLLVKRWKKLPAGSDRNWRHVVDARAGPGIKSMTKVKSKNKRLVDNNGEKNVKKKKHFEREYSPALSEKSDGSPDIEMADVEFFAENVPSRLSSGAASPAASDCEDNFGHSRRHKSLAKRRENTHEVSGFIDLDYWKQESVCCGIVFRGPNNELLVDARFLKPCNARLASMKQHGYNSVKATGVIADTSSIPKNYSDNSSDSGYDECSNPGAVDNNNAFKKAAPHLEDELRDCNEI
ncbi:hypothetical protein PPYR_10702 [Photinus pyralis]|uniref:Protein FAM60A n=1 Tax=Photinus pyralis TaxID=7054 RepID=A0A5N4AH36_PHOPY|nr:SIN3-HDAC complex-associated factor isoform X1 [Photinus pyralis]KAB0796641.1 hypothetical protein PPYR_10702 [Photinus pyralis]